MSMAMMKLEQAARLLAEIESIDDAKQVLSIAAAAEVYAKRAKLGMDVANTAAEIRLRAERRAGEILSQLGMGQGRRPLAGVKEVSPYAAALAAAGVSYEDAWRWRRMAAVQMELFERQLVEARAAGRELTRAVVLGSKSQPVSIQDRRTPRWLFDFLDSRFGPFKLDAFASRENALCKDYYTRRDDGCARPWADVTFANPEFEDMEPPLQQALRQAELGIRSVVVSPVGCAQQWFHELAIRGTVYVPDRRINFDLPDGTPTHRADRDTMILAFGGEHENPRWQAGEFRVRRLVLDEAEQREAA